MDANCRIGVVFITPLLLCYPALSLAVKGGMNTIFFALVCLSVYVIYSLKSNGIGLNIDRTTKYFSVAMILPTLTIFANQVATKSFDPHPYDTSLRFLLAPLIYIALKNLDAKIPAALEFSFTVGAIASIVVAILSPSIDGRATSFFLSAIHFGDLALMFGFLSLFSINWVNNDTKLVLLLKIFGLVAGAYISVESGTRGGWLAIPIVLALWLFFANQRTRKISPFLGVFLVLLACLASYFLTNMIQQRVDRAISNLVSYFNGNIDSGTAARLELWKASFYIFSENPFFGAGPEGFKEILIMLYDKGIITELVVIEGKAEAHSEIAGNLARYGALGLISILSLYLVPIWLFVKHIHSDSCKIAVAARMGICTSVAFFIFGLTVETFNIKMVAAFYSLTIAVLLAVVTGRQAIKYKHAQVAA